MITRLDGKDLLSVFVDTNYASVIAYLNGFGSRSGGVSVGAVITVLAYYFMVINIGLGVFNLIPIPPLDGSKILYAFLPDRILMRILPYERYIQIVLFVLVWLGVLSTPIHYLTNAIYSFLIRVASGVFF